MLTIDFHIFSYYIFYVECRKHKQCYDKRIDRFACTTRNDKMIRHRQ